MFGIIAFTYIGISLCISRWHYRNYDKKGTIRYKVGILIISPLLGLGWLQNKATGYLDVWFNQA